MSAGNSVISVNIFKASRAQLRCNAAYRLNVRDLAFLQALHTTSATTSIQSSIRTYILFNTATVITVFCVASLTFLRLKIMLLVSVFIVSLMKSDIEN